MKNIYKNKISISSFHIHKKVYNKYYLTEKYNVQTTNNRFFKKKPLKTKKKQKKNRHLIRAKQQQITRGTDRETHQRTTHYNVSN